MTGEPLLLQVEEHTHIKLALIHEQMSFHYKGLLLKVLLSDQIQSLDVYSH
jgi:hypothetical protein